MRKYSDAKVNIIKKFIRFKQMWPIYMVFILIICSTVYAKYIITKEFAVNISTAPFYFEAEIDSEIEFENEPSLVIKNNDGTQYNSYSTTYEVRLEGNDNFSLSIDGETSTDNVLTQTIDGGNLVDDSLDIAFIADVADLDITESATLKVVSTGPYVKQIDIPININLHEVTVTLNANGGTVGTSSMVVYKGKTYGELPTPTWAGHEFNGWYSAKTGGTKYESSTIVTTSASTQTLYAQWTSYLLADNVSVGDYVNYPVTYTNVATANSTTTHIASDDYTGWRVLSIEGTGDDKYVRLVSAGVPMTFVHNTGSVSTSITNLTTGFFNTAISSTATNYRFHLCGFKNSSGGSITTIAQLKTLFTNDYTQISSSTPKVQAMTKADLDKVWGKTTVNAEYLTSNDLLAIPSKDQTGEYATYYLATAYNSYLWIVYWEGAIVYTTNDRGIRPVVSLKASVETTGKTNGVWQLK